MQAHLAQYSRLVLLAFDPPSLRVLTVIWQHPPSVSALRSASWFSLNDIGSSGGNQEALCREYRGARPASPVSECAALGQATKGMAMRSIRMDNESWTHTRAPAAPPRAAPCHPFAPTHQRASHAPAFSDPHLVLRDSGLERSKLDEALNLLDDANLSACYLST